MDRRRFLFGTVLTCTSESFGQKKRNDAAKSCENLLQVQISESDRRIEKATSAALAMQRLDWEQGILAQAMLEAGMLDRLILLTRGAMLLRVPDGRLAVEIAGGATDPAMGGAAYAKAADYTGDSQMHSAVDGLLNWIRNKAPRSSAGVLYHVFRAPEMWSDGFNGAPPFLAAMGYYDEAILQINGFRTRLWSPEKHLLAHIWDDEKQQFQDGRFWGGGNGWAAAGLARVIRSLPDDRAQDRVRLAEFTRQIVDGCLKYQRSDGLFHDVVDQPETFVETNLAQMLAFAIYEGISAAWLPLEYRFHADNMLTAARKKMDANGFVHGVCSAPNFNRPGNSTEGQSFCIMMEAAAKRANTATSD